MTIDPDSQINSFYQKFHDLQYSDSLKSDSWEGVRATKFGERFFKKIRMLIPFLQKEHSTNLLAGKINQFSELWEKSDNTEHKLKLLSGFYGLLSVARRKLDKGITTTNVNLYSDLVDSLTNAFARIEKKGFIPSTQVKEITLEEIESRRHCLRNMLQAHTILKNTQSQVAYFSNLSESSTRFPEIKNGLTNNQYFVIPSEGCLTKLEGPASFSLYHKKDDTIHEIALSFESGVDLPWECKVNGKSNKYPTIYLLLDDKRLFPNSLDPYQIKKS